LESLLASLPVYMMIGIVVIVGISQFNRILGSILGIVFWIAVALVGATAYDKGGGISLLSIEFSKPGFYLFCGAFVAFNSFNLYMAMQRRRRWLMKRGSSSASDEE
jgi:hypothetical protein